MARVKNLDQVTGSLNNLSFYTRKGNNQIFVRTKGGASKAKIKRSPAFANVRKANMEFGGCSKMSREIREAFYGLEHVADFNLAPKFISLMKSIMNADTSHEKGERSILLSGYKYLLNGYNFNTIHPFATILRIALQWGIVREEMRASINIPAFSSSFGLNIPGNYALFRLRACLGLATDMQLNEQKKGYETVHDTPGRGFTTAETEWYSTQASIPAQELNLQLLESAQFFTANDTLILTVIIEFGTLDPFGNPTPIRGAGAGLIVGAG